MSSPDDHSRQNVNGNEGKLHDRIAVDIGTAIVNGDIEVGALLLTEQDAAKRYQVSRATYREAIRTLASKGLVSSRPKTGTRVNPRPLWAILDPEVIRWMFVGEPTHAAMRALFELRTIVEPAACEMAAERRTGEQLLVIGEAFERMARHGYSSAEGQVADGDFHAAVLHATGNQFLIGLELSIATAVRLTTRLKAAAAKHPRDPIPLHFEVYRAIADRDCGRARQACLQLLRIAREDSEVLLHR